MLHKLGNRLISLAKTLLVAYLAYAVLLFFLQRVVLYPGAKMSPGRSMTDPVPEGISQVWLDHTSGRSEAWWAPSPDAAPGPAIIFGHGNAELIEDWGREALDLSRRGVGVLLVEYPGYGLSEGKPTRASIGAAFEAAFDWVAAQPEVDRDRVVVLGRSLGGGVVTDLATAKPVRAVVLQSTFPPRRPSRFGASGRLASCCGMPTTTSGTWRNSRARSCFSTASSTTSSPSAMGSASPRPDPMPNSSGFSAPTTTVPPTGRPSSLGFCGSSTRTGCSEDQRGTDTPVANRALASAAASWRILADSSEISVPEAPGMRAGKLRGSLPESCSYMTSPAR